MIKIKKTETAGWKAAIRGMRNPMNSWEKSDSGYGCFGVNHICNDDCPCESEYEFGYCHPDDYIIGKNDHELMMKLRNSGTDHRKFMRMIICYCDITAPLYWWKEFDTYRNGVEKNSCSTMHKIHAKEFTLDDFSCEHIDETMKMLVADRENKTIEGWDVRASARSYFTGLVDILNVYREEYVKTKDKKWWWQMIQLLPSSYNQRRTVMMSYEALANMYHARKAHKLDEWREFCGWVESLPYAELITGGKENA